MHPIGNIPSYIVDIFDNINPHSNLDLGRISNIVLLGKLIIFTQNLSMNKIIDNDIQSSNTLALSKVDCIISH